MVLCPQKDTALVRGVGHGSLLPCVTAGAEADAAPAEASALTQCVKLRPAAVHTGLSVLQPRIEIPTQVAPGVDRVRVGPGSLSESDPRNRHIGPQTSLTRRRRLRSLKWTLFSVRWVTAQHTTHPVSETIQSSAVLLLPVLTNAFHLVTIQRGFMFGVTNRLRGCLMKRNVYCNVFTHNWL